MRLEIFCELKVLVEFYIKRQHSNLHALDLNTILKVEHPNFEKMEY